MAVVNHPVNCSSGIVLVILGITYSLYRIIAVDKVYNICNSFEFNTIEHIKYWPQYYTAKVESVVFGSKIYLAVNLFEISKTHTPVNFINIRVYLFI